MQNTSKKEWSFEHVEYPENTNACGKFQHAEIKLYYRLSNDSPNKWSDPMATLTYQQHYDTDKKEWSGYYAEELVTRALDVETLKAISTLFTKMSVFTESLYRRGLRPNAPYNDQYRMREAILTALRVPAIKRDRETGEIISVSCSC